MTSRGYIKRMDPKVFAKQNRATRGKRSGKMRGGDAVLKTAHCRGLDAVLFFTDRGRVHAVRAYEIPEASTAALGTPFTSVLQLKEGESITAMLPREDGSAEDPSEDRRRGRHLAMVTSARVDQEDARRSSCPSSKTARRRCSCAPGTG